MIYLFKNKKTNMEFQIQNEAHYKILLQDDNFELIQKNGEKIEKKEVELIAGADLESMTKDELEAFAREKGIEIDKRKSKENIIKFLREHL